MKLRSHRVRPWKFSVYPPPTRQLPKWVVNGLGMFGWFAPLPVIWIIWQSPAYLVYYLIGMGTAIFWMFVVGRGVEL